MKWISIDPGESTGFAVWEDEQLVYAGTRELWELVDAIATAAGVMEYVPNTLDPDLLQLVSGWKRLVVEDWRLYPDVMASGGLDYDTCRTARGIGAYELIARVTQLPIVLQPASIKSDAERAGAESLFLKPLHENRHANDAIRHGWFYIARQRPGATPSTVTPAEGAEQD